MSKNHLCFQTNKKKSARRKIQEWNSTKVGTKKDWSVEVAIKISTGVPTIACIGLSACKQRNQEKITGTGTLSKHKGISKETLKQFEYYTEATEATAPRSKTSVITTRHIMKVRILLMYGLIVRKEKSATGKQRRLVRRLLKKPEIDHTFQIFFILYNPSHFIASTRFTL